MVRVSLPSSGIVLKLEAPGIPAHPGPARKQLGIGPRRARLDDGIKLVGLSRVLPLLGGQVIDLPAPGIKRPCLLAAHAKQDKLGDIAEVEADTAAVGAAI